MPILCIPAECDNIKLPNDGEIASSWDAYCYATFCRHFASAMLHFASLISPTSTLGDVNEDGNVDASDATALINKILGLLNLDDTACEINADGTVDVSDVTSLITLILNQ